MPILGERQRLNRENVDRVPETTGVYALYIDGEIAYYGAAGGRETIRSRLAEHLFGYTQPGRASARHFSFESTRYPLSRECALLEEHKRQKWCLPTYNVRPPPLRGTRRPSQIEADEVLLSVVAELRRPAARQLTNRTPPKVSDVEVAETPDVPLVVNGDATAQEPIARAS